MTPLIEFDTLTEIDHEHDRQEVSDRGADRRRVGHFRQDLLRQRSGDGCRDRDRPRSRREGRGPRHRRREPRAAGLVGQDREGAGDHPQALVRSRHRRDREPRPVDDDRAGQAAGRSARRGGLWRLLHRVVRRGGQARLRAHDPDHRRVEALPHHQAADRRRRRDRAVEFPDRHDHAESGAGARFRAAPSWSSPRRRRRSARLRSPSSRSTPACRRACSTS